MNVSTDVVRAGIWRRGFAFGIDLLVAQIVLQLVAAALYPLSGDRIMDTTSFYTSCAPAGRQPAGVIVPPGFVPTNRLLCVKSFLGLQSARLYVVQHRDVGPVTTTTAAITVPLDASGKVVRTIDVAFLQYPLFFLLRWAMDRYTRGSLGRRICRNRLVRFAGQENGIQDVSWVARRYILFGLAIVPAFAVDIFAAAWGLLVGPLGPTVPMITGTLGTIPLWIAAVHALQAIARRRDTFYDALSGSAVAVVNEGSIEIADGAMPVASAAPPLVALFAGRVRRVVAAPPRLTLALLGVLAAVYAAELLHPAAPANAGGIAIPTLVMFGGADRELVVQIGQWYRLLFAPFLHGSVVHLAANGIAILAAGWVLEAFLGCAWFLTVFVLGGLAGSLASILWNAPALVAIGASGALMALLAAGYVVSGGLADGPRRRWIEAFCIGAGLPGLMANGHLAIGSIDVADHLGGAIGGALLGLVMLVVWRYPEPRPKLGTAALGSAMAVAAALLVSIPLAGFGSVKLAALLVPPDRLPKTDDEWRARCAELMHRYPSDPRPHLAQAIMDENAGDVVGRDRELDLTLAAARRFSAPSDHAFAINAWRGVGTAAQRRHDDTVAASLFSRIIAVAPRDADAYRARGDVEIDQQSYAAALRDFATLASLRPNNGVVEREIGDTFFAQGDLGAALDAYDRAVTVAPGDGMSLRQRGWARFYAGRGSEALRDLEKAAAEDPKDAYGAIWLDIVAVRSGFADRMAAAKGQLDLNPWPGPVVRYYLRELDEKALYDAASSPDSAVERDRRCEADFYVGEWLVMARADKQAYPYLQAASKSCPKDFYEWMAVQAELRGTAGFRPADE